MGACGGRMGAWAVAVVVGCNGGSNVKLQDFSVILPNPLQPTL